MSSSSSSLAGPPKIRRETSLWIIGPLEARESISSMVHDRGLTNADIFLFDPEHTVKKESGGEEVIYAKPLTFDGRAWIAGDLGSILTYKGPSPHHVILCNPDDFPLIEPPEEFDSLEADGQEDDQKIPRSFFDFLNRKLTGREDVIPLETITLAHA